MYFSPSHVHYPHLSMSFNACTVSSSKITSATITFSTNQYCLLPLTSILCRLSTILQARNSNIELHSDDLQVCDTLENSFGTLEATMKLFAKQGKGKAA